MSCNGEATAVSVIGGEVTYEWYTWEGTLLAVEQNNAGVASLTGLCPGLYKVQYTNGLENNTEWFSIGTNAGSAGVASETIICTGTGIANLFNRLDGTPSPGGVWTDPFGNPHSGMFNPATGMEGMHLYEVEVDGCTLQSAVIVEIVQNADPGLSTTYLICENYDPFLLSDVLAGTPDGGGQWFNTAQEEIDGYYDPETDETGLFTYMIDTVEFCPAVFSTMYIIENNLPDPGEDATLFVCPNALPFDMIDFLGGTPDDDGVWLNSANETVPEVFDPLAMPPGTYTYRVSGATPCPSVEADLTIEFSDGISAGSPAPLEVCSSADNIDLFDQMDGTYTEGGVWFDPAGNAVEPMIDPSTVLPGIYTYEVDAVGCQPVSSELVLSIQDPQFAGEGATVSICESDGSVNPENLLPDNADIGGTWWLNGLPLVGVLSVEGGQIYELEYGFPSNICPATLTTYTVLVDIQPQAENVPEINVCSTQDEFSLDGYVVSSTGFDLIWTDDDGEVFDGVVSPSEQMTGSYFFTIESGNTCEDVSGDIQLEIDDPIFESSSETLQWCYHGNEVSLFDLPEVNLPQGGTWYSDGIEIVEIIASGALSSGGYTYIIDDDGACEDASFTLNLNIETPLSAGNGADITVCMNASQLNASDVLGEASSGGDWYVGDIPVDEPVFDPSEGEEGYFTYVVPAVGPCPSDTSEVIIHIDEGFAFTGGFDQELCESDESIELGESNCTDCTYTWSPATGLNDPSLASPTFTATGVTETEVYTYAVVVSNGACTLTDEVTVTVHPDPQLEWFGPQVFCSGENVVFSVYGAESFEWQIDGIPAGAGNDLETVMTETAEVIITGTSEMGCSAQISFEPEVLELPAIDFALSPYEACYPANFIIDLPDLPELESEIFWEIDGEEYWGEQLVLDGLLPGSYDLEINAIAENGCGNSLTADNLMHVFPSPTASFTFDDDEISVLNNALEFENHSSGASAYDWQFGEEGSSSAFEPTFEFPELADRGYLICLEVENEFGCTDSVCKDLYIPGELTVYIPNAFTPDLDGVNDVFKPIVSGFEESSYRFSVFNRWGEMIFHTDDPHTPWRGEVDSGSHFAQDGSYMWVLEVRDAYSADQKRFEGHVLLLR